MSDWIQVLAAARGWSDEQLRLRRAICEIGRTPCGGKAAR